MKQKLYEIIGSIVGVTLFCAALWVLHHSLKDLRYADIVFQLKSIPLYKLLLAFLCTILSYLALSGYDVISLRHLRIILSYPKVLLTSFVTYSLGHNIGLSLFTGGSIRLRLYGSFGLSTLQITSLIGMNIITFWLGYLTSGSLIYLIKPFAIPPGISLPFATTFPIGLLFATILAIYLTWILLIRKPLRIGGWQFDTPSLGITLGQTSLGVFDWLVASGALYLLLPESAHLNYPQTLGIYLLSQIAGLASNVPGGIGVFESVFVLLAGEATVSAELVGSILAFRIIYYLVPLCVAALSLAVFEFSRRKEGLRKVALSVGLWVHMFVPQLFAIITFFTGVVLIISGATPSGAARIEMGAHYLPLAVLEIFHFASTLLGFGLLILARSLQRRIEKAHSLAIAVLILGAIASILKGFDFELAAILIFVILLLLPARSYFYRKSPLFGKDLTPPWIVAISAVIVASIWLVVFSFKHSIYFGDLLWKFDFEAESSRVVRASFGLLTAALLFMVWRLFKRLPPEPKLPAAEELNQLEVVIRHSPQATANLAYLGDKEILRSPSGSAFLMYGITERCRVSCGDPVGPVEEWRELIWQFHEMCDRHGVWTVFYQVGADHLPLYLDFGLSAMKIGEEARISLSEFQRQASDKIPPIRNHKALVDRGCTIEFLTPEDLTPNLSAIREISDAWLKLNNIGERKFSHGYFDSEYLSHGQIAVVSHDGDPIAFANLLIGNDKEEIACDMMRHQPGSPEGITDYLLIEVINWGHKEGFKWLNLGIAPLEGSESKQAEPLWNQLGTYLHSHGGNFRSFEAERRYKNQFSPVWESKYLVSPGGVAVFRVFSNIASLISGPRG